MSDAPQPLARNSPWIIRVPTRLGGCGRFRDRKESGGAGNTPKGRGADPSGRGWTPSLKRSKPIIGIVGTIGAGKSAVAGLLAEIGAGVIDSDAAAHEVLQEEDVRRTLVQWWGPRVCPDGQTVDRSVVASIVFADPEPLRRLEGLLYPRIAARRDAQAARFDQDAAIRAIVLDAPKLIEAGLDGLCDAVLLVDADRDLRLKRLAASRGWTEGDLLARERRQISVDEKRAKADEVIINDADLSALRPVVRAALERILEAFHRGRPDQRRS
ncbi:MAG: Dephospho-CoA kinase [Phycisphaerae bacterium]|nr:Dephospho-CoA kinase [Phycisphaerae bacterium]